MRRSRWWLQSIAAILSLALVAMAIAQTATVAPGNGPFERTWARTDRPVAELRVTRTWMWGPQANTSLLYEDYAESPDGRRVVQYFDKSRMEITNPGAFDDGVWYVTNGLLVVEMVNGHLQLGDNSYDQSPDPAHVNVAGDQNDSLGPTYASFTDLQDDHGVGPAMALGVAVNRDGTLSFDARYQAYDIYASQYEVTTEQWIADPFWSFMTSRGTIYRDGAFADDAIFPTPYYATGLPITDAYWSRVTVGGTVKDVLIQCFERRCLTYTPSNPVEWRVEAGNVGQHYYAWRYPTGNPTPAPTSTVAPPTNTPTPVPPTATATPTQVPPTATATSPPQQNCHSSYPDFCIPPPPPDLDCGDFWQTDFTVIGSDPHRLDGDNDGIGCES